MALPRFYVTADLRPGSTGALDAQQTRQARSVLRLAAGSTVMLFDGTGVEAVARIVSPIQSGATYEVESISMPDREPPLRLTVGLAVLKGDRFEVAVQKLTELGVATIAPLLTERTVVSFNVARDWAKRADRYGRIAREATEQSERVSLPEIANPQSLADFLRAQPATVLVERTESVLLGSLPTDNEAAIAVGPEGGWSAKELALIEREAAQTATLGSLILRAETAAIVAAGTLMQNAWAARAEPRSE